MVKSGVSLLVFTLICITLVQLSFYQTKDKIQENITQVLQAQIKRLVPDYNNNITTEKKEKTIFLHNITQTIDIYPAKKNDTLVAYLIKHTYPQGYSGNIVLLSAISSNQKLIGTRVISHQETPGLGDGIERNKSDWILQLNQLSISNKPWKTQRDGGRFDVLTGATISSRAVINAGYEVLAYFTINDIL